MMPNYNGKVKKTVFYTILVLIKFSTPWPWEDNSSKSAIERVDDENKNSSVRVTYFISQHGSYQLEGYAVNYNRKCLV